ncbi:FAD binding domain-containing protein [Capillimicrobium parvum]|uniref:Aldehyde oxidoreductase FAD-binding subunit PaoB n=1 Tax=Capillimicrobium parvum TaxID=2884022 RepID=A0A9E6Y1H5_9ACTN|nr:xanthine dehydrogenase family protein subunit M [Capillimicrobium parvum]UGS38344.1 Aldehyde oxidoreductase FAD-binding subunit PaoB [Capillimicrobium parvum]
MRPFTYERAVDAAGAVAAAARFDGGPARYLGGGTNLVDLMRLGVERPEHLIDVSRLALDCVEEVEGGGLRIGAAVRNSDLAAHPLVLSRYPVLAQALLQGASGQLRNLATVGGNLLQRTRCPYFQDVTKPCNKRRPGSGCPAVEGEHRNLAVIGHSPACVATHPSDMAVAMTALGATVSVQGPGGERTIGMPGLHRLPGDDPARDTVLEPAELITAVTLPPAAAGARSRYRKVRERASFAFALVSVAAVLRLDDEGRVGDCAIALGGLAHAPWRARRAEEALRGGPADEAAFARAAEAELAQARPLRDNAYKVGLARNVLERTLVELAR